MIYLKLIKLNFCYKRIFSQSGAVVEILKRFFSVLAKFILKQINANFSITKIQTKQKALRIIKTVEWVRITIKDKKKTIKIDGVVNFLSNNNILI